ncbi:fibronectin type III domain-containing protein, partial [bacterium]|nr:fibronectin type III domain-containing protein [bacterium]
MLSVYTHNLAVKEAKRIVLIAVLLCLFLLPVVAGAAMRSSSYIIYENINHAFDGPVISGISASVTGAQVTVTWDTDVIADQFIIYDTDSGFSDSHEQGSSVKSSTTHTVILTGLSENTLYYYQVKSTRINGGTTIDSTVRTATSGSAAGPGGGEEEEPPSGGGGGILIIDKTDKIAPEISDLSINTISFNSVEIVWQTDEPATSFVEYGLSISYGATFGEWSSTTE